MKVPATHSLDIAVVARLRLASNKTGSSMSAIVNRYVFEGLYREHSDTQDMFNGAPSQEPACRECAGARIVRVRGSTWRKCRCTLPANATADQLRANEDEGHFTL